MTSHVARRGLVYCLAIAGLAGCGSIMSGDKFDYKSETKKAPTLEIPPDLTQLQRDTRYSIPETNNGTATASSYNQQQSQQQSAQPGVVAQNASISNASVAPTGNGDMHIERAGNQRWLVVKQSPDVLWPEIKDFWQDSGFVINEEKPQAGVMETDWAENRAKIPQDIIRTVIGKALDALYSTGERDKFRTRLERRPDGSTEIYISHRGMQEVFNGKEQESTIWTPRPSDPGLEAEFLSRLMARLSGDKTRAKAAIANAPVQPSRAKLVKAPSGGYVEVDEGFDRAWRRVGLALDRVGFTVEDRDRTQGLYFVRYVDSGKDAEKGEKGFFSKLFTGSDDNKSGSAQRYRVAVKATGEVSQVAVLNNDGKPDTSRTADKILSLLNDQLK